MKFTEEQLAKIRESLSASGIPNDVVEFTISDISADEEESTESKEENKPGDQTEENAEEGNQVDQPTENDNSQEAPVDEQLGEAAPVEEPIAEEVPPVSEEQLPPPAEEVPPVEEPMAPQPAMPGYDDTELRGLLKDAMAELEETKKANEGLLARVDSLEEALKKGGFLDDSQAPIGDESPKAPAQVTIDDPMDDVLAQINGHKY